VGAHLGVWGFIPSHFFALSGAWNVTPKLHTWPALSQTLALVATPRLGLWHILPNLGQWYIEVSGERKVYKFWTIQIHGFLEGKQCANFHIWNEDKAICGVLKIYFVSFVKIVVASKYNSFGGLLAFKQLEI